MIVNQCRAHYNTNHIRSSSRHKNILEINKTVSQFEFQLLSLTSRAGLCANDDDKPHWIQMPGQDQPPLSSVKLRYSRYPNSLAERLAEMTLHCTCRDPIQSSPLSLVEIQLCFPVIGGDGS